MSMRLIVRTLRGCLGLVLGVTVAACSSSPAQPAAVVGVPTALTPIDGSQIPYNSQPIVLTALNATVSGGTAATYTFEVATDPGFATKVQTKANIAPGGNSQTNVALDSLAVGKDYYWHVRSQAGSTTGQFSNTLKFTILAFAPPTPVSPLNGAAVSGWPTFTVANAQQSGSTGPFVYRFDVATSADFSNILVTGTVPETTNQTSFTPSNPPVLTSQATLSWRVTAINQATGVSSPPSNTQTLVFRFSAAGSIAALEGLVLWPGTQPPGNSGSARLGDSWNVQTVNSIGGVRHVTPTIDELRVFDMLDRGFDPQGAIDWINSHGYGTNAAWYPGPQVVGFDFEYMAYINGEWDLIFKLE